MFQARAVSCTNKVSSNNCRYSCANVPLYRKPKHSSLGAGLCLCTSQGKAHHTDRVWLYLWSCIEINVELHNIVFSNQASLDRLQPLPAFIPLPSALPSVFWVKTQADSSLTPWLQATDIWRNECSGVLGCQIRIRSTSLQESWTSATPRVNLCPYCSLQGWLQQWRWEWMASLRGSCCCQSNYLWYIIQYYFGTFSHFVTGDCMVKSGQVKQPFKSTPGKSYLLN